MFANRVSNSFTATRLLEWSSFLMLAHQIVLNSALFQEKACGASICRTCCKTQVEITERGSGSSIKPQLSGTVTHVAVKKKRKSKSMMHRQAVAGQSLSIFTVGCRPSVLQLMLFVCPLFMKIRSLRMLF